MTLTRVLSGLVEFFVSLCKKLVCCISCVLLILTTFVCTHYERTFNPLKNVYKKPVLN